MYPPGHVGLTAILFAPLVCWFRATGRERTATECLLVAVALSVLPDVDTLLPGLVHRGVTHTLLAAVVAGLALAMILRHRGGFFSGLAGEDATVVWFVGTAGVVSHLLGDVVTPMGIQPLFPLLEAGYTFDVVRASSPAANTLLLLSGVAAVLFSYSVPVRAPHREVDDGAAEEPSLSVLPFTRR